MSTPIPIRSLDPRLGRRINHDPRSKRYTLDTFGLGIMDVEWPYHLPVLDQGQVGKCTAEAALGCLGSDPYWETLPPAAAASATLVDGWTDQFYSDEETLNGDGPYPPQDNGSDGLTSAKVAQQRGLISGYEHTFTADDAIRGLQLYPLTWGTLWKSGMDDVNVDTGQVSYSGTVRGGHELCIYKVVAAAEQLWFHQSWGAWGYQNSGVAWISFTDFAASLADQGDATFFTPLNEPAPQPAPPPPATSTSITWDTTDVALLDGWAAKRHSRDNRLAALAWQRGQR